jgi:LuxR family maltose regulon positive regulatory protein
MVPGGLEGFTVWLAEVAQTAMSVVLIVDEADRLPPASRDALAYLLRNAPPNLRAIVGARSDSQLGLDDLVDYGQAVVIGPSRLRFQLDETIALARARFGSRVDHDTAAQLHELTEGWPLGLQLALTAISTGTDPKAVVAALAAPVGEVRDHVVGLLLANLDPQDLDFVTRIAILDPLHPDLCAAVTGEAMAAERLARMTRDTPIFVAAEQGEWLRMHALARDVLRRRVQALPEAEQRGLHARAAAWLAANGLLERAAEHALRAGQRESACELAERSLYGSLMTRGNQRTVLDWLARMAEDELDRHPRLLLAAAWSLALSERHDEAGRLVERLLAQPGVDDALRCECALILSGAAVFADQPDRFAELHDPWAESPPLSDPLLVHVHANRSSFRELLGGDPAMARLRQQQAPREDQGHAHTYLARWGEFIVGLSFLWEGQVLLADKLLQPALARADADLGRRNAFACSLATLVAAAAWECDRPAEAAALLANRLDVIERGGLPEAVLLGFRTMARIAIAEGAEHRALELLGALRAVGRVRALPRLEVVSLVEQVRMHARRFRQETSRDLCGQIDTLLGDPALPQGRLWRRSVEVLRELALGYAAIAAQDWRRALEPLGRADALAREIQQGRLHIEILALQAFALDRCGEKRAHTLIREAADLARSRGLARVFADAHPALGDWVRQVVHGPGGPDAAALSTWSAPPAKAPPSRELPHPRSTPSTALTPKEREVLELLARNLSNKEIGLAMQVGEETIKWHMKNLFAKLDAGTRKQVVQRARILGLLETLD